MDKHLRQFLEANGLAPAATDAEASEHQRKLAAEGIVYTGPFEEAPAPEPEAARAEVATEPAPAPVTIADTERMVFRSQGVVLVTRCLEGKYPNYDSVIPVDSPHRVVVSREALRLALRRLNLFASTASNMAVMRRDGERFVIEASDTEFSGSGSEQVSIHEGDAFLPDDFKIGFKISNSLTLLDAIPTENVVLFFSDAGRAFLYKPEDVKSARLLMQMPMIINE